MRHLRLALYVLAQWTWGLPQNLIGLFLALGLKKQRRRRYHGAAVVYYAGCPRLAKIGCFACGMFIFMDDTLDQSISKKILAHEYGHTVQSLLFGPFFLLAVGLPSFLWAGSFRKNRNAYKEKGIAYISRYPENSANRWGERITGERTIDW